MQVWTRVVPVGSQEPPCFLAGFPVGARQKKLENFFLGGPGLVGQKQVTGLVEEDESCARNAPGDQLSVGTRYEPVRFAMDDQRRRGDLRDSTIAFPGKDRLELRHISLLGW